MTTSTRVLTKHVVEVSILIPRYPLLHHLGIIAIGNRSVVERRYVALHLRRVHAYPQSGGGRMQ